MADDVVRRLVEAAFDHHEDSAEAALVRVQETYGRLYDVMAPIFGENGFWALFSQAIRTTRSEYPALVGVSSRSSSRTLDDSWNVLVDAEPSVVRQTAIALFVTYSDLLASFIGRELSLRLLRSVWPSVDPSAVPPSSETP